MRDKVFFFFKKYKLKSFRVGGAEQRKEKNVMKTLETFSKYESKVLNGFCFTQERVFYLRESVGFQRP